MSQNKSYSVRDVLKEIEKADSLLERLYLELSPARNAYRRALELLCFLSERKDRTSSDKYTSIHMDYCYSMLDRMFVFTECPVDFLGDPEVNPGINSLPSLEETLGLLTDEEVSSILTKDDLDEESAW